MEYEGLSLDKALSEAESVAKLPLNDPGWVYFLNPRSEKIVWFKNV